MEKIILINNWLNHIIARLLRGTNYKKKMYQKKTVQKELIIKKYYLYDENTPALFLIAFELFVWGVFLST